MPDMTGSESECLVLDETDLSAINHAREFQGHLFGVAGASFIWVDMPPGGGVRLHRHPYQEVFVVQEGRGTFTAGATTLEVRAPRVVIVRAGVAHKFVNTGPGRARHLDIHVSRQMSTEWLEG